MVSLGGDSSKRNIMVICLLAFLADMVGGIISPTRTLFAIDIGASITFIGLMAALSSVTSLIAAIPLGVISDRGGRKTLILAGFVLRICATAIYGLASHPYHLLASVILQSVGGLASYMNFRAYIADSTEPHLIGRAVSFYTTSMGIGVTIGPLVGGFASGLWGYRQSYFIASFVAFTGAVTAFVGLEPVRPGASSATQKMVPQASRLLSILRDRMILWMSLMNIINFTLMGMIMTYFPVLGKGLGYTPEVIGFIFFVRGLATTMIRIPAGLAITRLGEPLLMISALASGILGLVALPLTDNYLIIVLLMVVQGLTFGGFLTSSSTFLLHFAPPSERGTTLGLVRIFQGTLNTVNSYIIGITADYFGVKSTYLTVGSTLAIALSVMVVLGHTKQVYKRNNVIGRVMEPG